MTDADMEIKQSQHLPDHLEYPTADPSRLKGNSPWADFTFQGSKGAG